MKKTFLLLSLFALLLTACKGGGNTPTTPITLSAETLTMKVGDMEILKATGQTSALTWTSSDTTVATVQLGIVQAVGIGDAYITAAQADGANAKCRVFVTGSDGSSLRLMPGAVEVEKGQQYQLKLGNTYGMPLVWHVSNEEIATIDETGLVTAHKPGVCIVTVSNGGEECQSVIAVLHHWSEYELVWSDEFGGTSLDESVWTIQTGIGNAGWGNQEKQYYTGRTENLRVEDGNLIIEARKEDYNGSEYTSARIMSQNKKDFTYGKMEASISLPSGGGLWPAFWMLGYGGWPACGEIDIMEYVGNVPNRILGTLHTKFDRDGAHSSKSYWGCNNVENNYHVYGIEWTQEETLGRDVIRFSVDGEVYSTQTEAYVDDPVYWPFNKPEYFIINLAVGGTLGGRIDDAIWNEPRLMKIDWVRVYQRHEVE